jgi:hypothetical protein
VIGQVLFTLLGVGFCHTTLKMTAKGALRMQIGCFAIYILLLCHLFTANTGKDTIDTESTEGSTINPLHPVQVPRLTTGTPESDKGTYGHTEDAKASEHGPTLETAKSITDQDIIEDEKDTDSDSLDQLGPSSFTSDRSMNGQQATAFGFLFLVLLIVVWCVNRFIVSEHGNGVINL